ncbi:alpha/beta fold hydrolase [Streptomyces purpureus]|uniref:3-oxoadipate enol-lactone hydrolase n=1 Tax=Streptomyces purpureus TaxID=1951 RepID=A0A918HHZ5_9ACTN|nr:alpha/beta hydrolase [Streptomyces purpureus]GGT64784.1 3-oxoadipate enol-lactone hydrolase [Streptomyces purpureus]
MSVVLTRGTEVHYRTEGKGPHLLLVHGSTADSASNFSALAPLLTDHHTLITPDYAGSGDSPLPEGGELTLDLLVEQIAATARATTDQPVDLAGSSLGAVIAAATAAAHPHLVRRLILIGGWARNDDPRQQAFFTLWRRLADLDPASYEEFITLFAHSPAHLAAQSTDQLADMYAASQPTEGARRQIDLDLTVDIRARLSKITAETLVVGATLDHVVPVHHARELHASIPHSHYAELDCGHNTLHERPKELADLINQFLT